MPGGALRCRSLRRRSRRGPGGTERRGEDRGAPGALARVVRGRGALPHHRSREARVPESDLGNAARSVCRRLLAQTGPQPLHAGERVQDRALRTARLREQLVRPLDLPRGLADRPRPLLHPARGAPFHPELRGPGRDLPDRTLVLQQLRVEAVRASRLLLPALLEAPRRRGVAALRPHLRRPGGAPDRLPAGTAGLPRRGGARLRDPLRVRPRDRERGHVLPHRRTGHHPLPGGAVRLAVVARGHPRGAVPGARRQLCRPARLRTRRHRGRLPVHLRARARGGGGPSRPRERLLPALGGPGGRPVHRLHPQRGSRQLRHLVHRHRRSRAPRRSGTGGHRVPEGVLRLADRRTGPRDPAAPVLLVRGAAPDPGGSHDPDRASEPGVRLAGRRGLREELHPGGNGCQRASSRRHPAPQRPGPRTAHRGRPGAVPPLPHRLLRRGAESAGGVHGGRQFRRRGGARERARRGVRPLPHREPRTAERR